MNGWDLPKSLQVGGVDYHINADFRDILEIIRRLLDEGGDRQVNLYVCLALFYDGFEQMPESDYQEAVEKMFDFIACGEEPDNKPALKLIDWEQDRQMIISDVNRAAGMEIRALKFCHWWTFISWFQSIGEGQLSAIVSIREKKRRHRKLSDWEREFYRENRRKVDFQPKYTEEEKAEIDRLNAIFK